MRTFCKKLAKTICIVGTAIILSNAFGFVESIAAENAVISRGNIIIKQEASDGAEELTAEIYASDIKYLKNEIDKLLSEL